MDKKNKLAVGKNKSVVTLMIVVAAVAVVFGFKLYKDNSNLAKLKTSFAKVKGDSSAPIKIVEFVDFQCPACANGSKFLKQYMQDHPNQIHLELKYYPLPMHPHGRISARYAECAARQDKFWPFIDVVFERQDKWKILFEAYSTFDAIAKEVGVNAKELETCLHDPKAEEQIDKNKQEGKALGVQSTPTYFVNDTLVVGVKNLEFEINKIVGAQSK